MPEKNRRSLFVASNLNDYRNLFSDDWGQRILKLTESKFKLSAIAFDLLVEWRAAAYTASLPVTILDHVKAYHDGFVNSGKLDSSILRFAEEITAKIAQDVPDLTVDPSLIRRLQERLISIGAEVKDAREKARLDFQLKVYSSRFLGIAK